MLRCTKCGNTSRFRASQSCRGTITVIVDGAGNWLENDTTHGGIDESSLDFDDPEGPYECCECYSDRDVEETEP